ncbi:hypothetical protein WL81_02525 [Burkholderia ubonensis]|nr:hypothetical protein WL81_02525 [Burkholderia ubonensis]
MPPERSDRALVPIAIAFVRSLATDPPTAAFMPRAMFPEDVVAPAGATVAPYPIAIEPVSTEGTTRAFVPIAALLVPVAVAASPTAILSVPIA